MTVDIKRACVMGYPVAHSRSPMIHGHWLKTMGIVGEYGLKELTPEAFPHFITHLAEHGYVGGNITAPHKMEAYRCVDRRHPSGEVVGAVNTVWFEGDALVGGNSDTHGFVANLDDHFPQWEQACTRAVVLGAGGAARSIVHGLQDRNVAISIVNRTFEHAETLATYFGGAVKPYGYEELSGLLLDADMLINCTPLGMTGKAPLLVDLTPLKLSALVCDVNYVPLETAFMADARARGHPIVDGLGMLLHQAGFGFEKWFGAAPQVTAQLRALLEADIRSKTAAR